MNTLGSDSERILVLAPAGRDAALALSVMTENGFGAVVCPHMEDLCEKIGEGAGVGVLTEEVLTFRSIAQLGDVIARQPAWSDFPLLICSGLTRRHDLETLGRLGNVSALERPLRTRTLLTAVQTALRARRHQYGARKAIEQRDQFLAMLGHELRNPLGAIMIAVRLMRRRQDAECQDKQARVIERQALHLQRLVDDLLDVSRVTSGKVNLKPALLDLNRLAIESVHGLIPGAAAAGLKLSVKVADSSVPVRGDAVRIEQIVNNLLTNAMKYTPEGGAIHVSVERTPKEAILRVRDTGIGIAPAMIDSIFDLFTQVEETLARAQGGMGIGLTLVRALVEMHGGRVQAQSDGLGRGSEFTVAFPVAQPVAEVAAPGAPGAGAKEEPGRRPCRIVIVEDNEDLREGLIDFLSGAGHVVTSAGDGKAGIARILADKPEVALIDIGLPLLDGYEVARKVRSSLGQSVYLLALSGYGQERDQVSAREAGFDRHMTKPVDIDALQVLLEQRNFLQPPG